MFPANQLAKKSNYFSRKKNQDWKQKFCGLLQGQCENLVWWLHFSPTGWRPFAFVMASRKKLLVSLAWISCQFCHYWEGCIDTRRSNDPHPGSARQKLTVLIMACRSIARLAISTHLLTAWLVSCAVHGCCKTTVWICSCAREGNTFSQIRFLLELFQQEKMNDMAQHMASGNNSESWLQTRSKDGPISELQSQNTKKLRPSQNCPLYGDLGLKFFPLQTPCYVILKIPDTDAPPVDFQKTKNAHKCLYLMRFSFYSVNSTSI